MIIGHNMLKFNNRILMIGYGSVARCTLPILHTHLNFDPSKLTILDYNPPDNTSWIPAGTVYRPQKITPDNINTILSQHLSSGDLLIDLAWNIDCKTILQWCHDNNVFYINTSVEIWNPYETIDIPKRTLYWRHNNLQHLKHTWSGPTAILEHGANPGLISHFVKAALIDIAQNGIADKKFTNLQAEKIHTYIKSKSYNHLAMEMGVKVIHCSERDTQITNKPKQVDEFVNTWSVEGFHEEGTTTAELGWGTHEKTLPPHAIQHKVGTKSQICLARMGMNCYVRSWVPPNHNIVGMLVRHGESLSITEHLTVKKHNQVIYRPTVHYAYCPCDAAIASLHELRGNNYQLQSRSRIMTDEITSGSDILGALVMGHPYGAWWCGSDLSIEESRTLVPHQNATTMQVAISIVAAVLWMLKNPDSGLCVPDDLPHDEVLETCKPYLGKFISCATDWSPLRHHHSYFRGYNDPDLDYIDKWQFKNFLITED